MRKGRHPTHPPFPSCNRPRHRCTARRVRSRPFQNIYFCVCRRVLLRPFQKCKRPRHRQEPLRSFSRAFQHLRSLSGASGFRSSQELLSSLSEPSHGNIQICPQSVIFSPGDPGVSQKPLRSLSGASLGGSQEPLRIQELSGASQQPFRTLA